MHRWKELHSQHVVDSHVAHHGTVERGLLGEDGAHQQSAVAPPFDREVVPARVTAVNEVARAGDEIIKDVLLSCRLSLFVPGLSELSPAEIRSA